MNEFVADIEKTRIVNLNAIKEVDIQVEEANADCTLFKVVGYTENRTDFDEYPDSDSAVTLGYFDNPIRAAQEVLKVFPMKRFISDDSIPIENLAAGKTPMFMQDITPEMLTEYKNRYVDNLSLDGL